MSYFKAEFSYPASNSLCVSEILSWFNIADISFACFSVFLWEEYVVVHMCTVLNLY